MRTGLSLAAQASFNRLFPPLSAHLTLGCADCHGRTIVDQWSPSAHAQGTDNDRFLTMYNGTDVHGSGSPETRYVTYKDYGTFPLPPNLAQLRFGPGFKLDFPDQAGSCATCHTPTAALRDPYETDVNHVEGIDRLGTHCDFCHKVIDVAVDPETLVPDENAPSVLSMELRRPDGEPQMFFGPFDDMDVGPNTYSPLQNDSRFCAACHNASFWGIPVYQSYSELLASPYPQEGKTCQTWHMRPDGITTNFAHGRGGQERDPETIFSHSFPGAGDAELLQNTASLEVAVGREGDQIVVVVGVTNESAGHHIPTDHPMRNILLVVSARDAQGRLLEHLEGPRVPAWGGVGPDPNDYAGRPETGYAKVLEELWTGVTPTAAYWNPTVLRADTRIPARETHLTRHVFFAPPGGGTVSVEARLVFRRAFKPLAAMKGWDVPDILMEEVLVSVPQ